MPDLTLDLDTVFAGLTMASVAATIIVLVVFAPWSYGEDSQCHEKRGGTRCIHNIDHPGSHRDQSGNHWN